MMKFILGERKQIGIKITSTSNLPFTIRNATYTLIHRKNWLIADSGTCDIVGHEIRALLEPSEEGDFIVEFSYEIANEFLKATVGIEVDRYANA